MVVFAVDGGAQVGYGHVGRCLAICEELDGGGAFAVSDGGVRTYLRQRGVSVISGPAGSSGGRVIVLDRAGQADPQKLAGLKRDGKRVALVDDPGPGRAVADLVVDPPTGADWPPASGRRLHGFEHALIRREIREANPAEETRSEVLVSLGASDPTDATPGLVAALTRAGMRAKAVLGPGYSGPAIDRVHQIEPQHWPSALAGARLLLTRFGHTLLEAAHLGVPAIAITLDARDRTDAEGFAVHGTARAADASSPPAIVQAVRELLADQSARTAMARTGRGLIDGLGGRRVARALLELDA